MGTETQAAGTNGDSYDVLLRQHQEYERRLEELNKKSWLTPNEELEAKQIKKMKLKIKDRLAQLSRTGS